MYKSLKFACILILSILCFKTTSGTDLFSKTDKINWDAKYRLTFDDFKGRGARDTVLYKNDMEYRELGKITKAILVKNKADSKGAEFSVYAVMDRDRSWLRNQDDTATLKHEQGHFDICEIYARILRKNISDAKSVSEAKEMYYQVIKDETTEQKLYDKDNSGIPEGINSYWEEKIKSRLAELEEYSNPEVTVKFGAGADGIN